MPNISVDFRGVKKLLVRMGNSGEVLQREARELALRLEAASVDEAPSKTGTLRRSINTFFTPTGALIQASVSRSSQPLKYANFVHKGTKAHTIHPRNKKALAFKKGGRMMMAKSVRHPGTKPNPFFTRAVNKNSDLIAKLAQKFINAIIKGR